MGGTAQGLLADGRLVNGLVAWSGRREEGFIAKA